MQNTKSMFSANVSRDVLDYGQCDQMLDHMIKHMANYDNEKCPNDKFVMLPSRFKILPNTN